MAVDAWEMAADCARAIEASKDPTRRALVGTLQKLWIELGNKERLLSEQHVLKEMEDLYALHEVVSQTLLPFRIARGRSTRLGLLTREGTFLGRAGCADAGVQRSSQAHAGH